ncbi:outer membrane beta-barrel protein [Sphingopyxis sp.]|uniref:outer membrane beta-barrel protein n=1 Tax=Sphingopyxis sp. TaxID=1908224 RepID=UPI003D0A2882
MAEPVSQTAPLVSADLKDYETPGLDVAGFQLRSEVETMLTADDNVYASSTGKRSDAVFRLSAGLEARRKIGNVELRATGKTSIRRMATLTSENAETASTEIGVFWEPSASHRFNFSGGWSRLVEDRGDPEALNLQSTGPRLTNLLEAQAQYRHEGGRIFVAADTAVRKYDVLGLSNSERDFTSLIGSLTLGYSVSSQVYGTVTGYVNNRNFRLPVTIAGFDQDATTIGGRLGFSTKGEGLVQGRVGIGLFRLNPSDPTLDGRSGLSADVSLIVRPRRRTAITLDISAGDVATFRLGAIARSDKRASLSIQQEARHNLYGTLGFVIRESTFLGSGIKERTIGPNLEIEWLLRRGMSLVGFATYQHRSSDDPIEGFERFRGGISLRFRY